MADRRDDADSHRSSPPNSVQQPAMSESIMRKLKEVLARPVVVKPSAIIWSDEKLAALDVAQLGNLLDNLPTQLARGRISEEAAANLEKRIESRLPARKLAVRKERKKSAGQV